MRKGSTAIIVAAVMSVTVFGAPPEKDPYAHEKAIFKKMFNFDKWPNKNGKVIAGFYHGWFRAEDGWMKENWSWSRGSASGVWKYKGKAFKIDVCVAKTCSRAQEILVLTPIYIQRADIVKAIRRGRDLGYKVGDVSLIFPSPKRGVFKVAFCRNNIFVAVSLTDNTDQKVRPVSLVKIAQKIDKVLSKQPTYKSLEASGLCPKIIAKAEKTTTTAKVAMEEIEEGKLTPRYFIDPIPVRFKVDDPSNLKVRLKKFAFEGTIDWNADKGAYCFSWEYYDSEKKGFNKPLKCKIRFVAVNERLLWTTKEITITINPPK